MQAKSISDFLLTVSNMTSAKLFFAYLVVVFLGRFWMNYVRRVECRKLMGVYNFACSIVNLYTTLGFFYHNLTAGHFLSRETNDSLKLVFFVYWCTKIVELLDTVFMILRHRGRQISFLHVFHHASMLVLSEYAYRVSPVVSMAMFLGINSLVHVVLYFYYGLTAMNPSNPPKWKKHLTKMQIVQFMIDIVVLVYGYSHGVYCIYGVCYGLSMLYLFSNFYYQAYVKPKKA